jgi:uncharacterized protein
MENTNPDLVFNVAQLLKEPVGSTRKLSLESAELLLDDGASLGNEGDVLSARELEGQVKVTKLGDGVLVQGDVEAKVTLECSRCLETFEVGVDAGLEEQFQPTIDVDTGAPIHRADFEQTDGAFEIDANHMMDLAEPVRQALLVALPMKPLCREDCKGICPQCGVNLNEVDCGHTDESEDNRWAGLRELNLADFPADSNRGN